MIKVVFFVFMMASVVFADTSEESSKKLYPVSVEGKYGLIDELGKMVIDPIYENCAFLHNMVYAVKDNNYYIFNNDGKLLKSKLLEFELNLPYHMRNDMDHFFLYSFNGKRGVIDTMLNGIVEPLYDFIEIVENKYFIVSKNSKKGVINLQGKVVVDIIYDYIRYLKEDCFSVSVDEKYGIINSEGKLIVPVECSSIGWQFQDEVIWVSRGGRSASDVIVGGKWALIRKDGYNITGFTYDAVDAIFYEGLCPVYIKDKPESGEKRVGKWGYMNTKGEIVIPFRLLHSASSFKYGHAVIKKDGKEGLINKNNNFVLPMWFSQIRYWPEGIFIVNIGGKGDSCCIPLEGGEWALLDRKGKVLHKSTLEIDIGNSYCNDGMINYFNTTTEKWGYLNINGKIAVPAIYDEVKDFENGFAEVYLNNEKIIIKKNGQRISVAEMKSIEFGKRKWIIIEDTKRKDTGVTIEFLNGERITVPDKKINYSDDKMIGFISVRKKTETNSYKRKYAYVNIDLQKIVWIDK